MSVPDSLPPVTFYRAVYCAALGDLLPSESHREDHLTVPLYTDAERCERSAAIATLSARSYAQPPEEGHGQTDGLG